jgi:O-antigen/teichoic acid export membrane protein
MLGGMGVLFSSLLFLNSNRIASWLNNDALAGYTPLIGVYLIFMLMGTVLEISMITRKRYRLATATYVVSDILRAALLLLPALITRSLEWAFIGGVAFCMLRVAAIARYLYTEFDPAPRFDAGLLRQQLAYALPFFCSVIVHIFQQNYHQYAVSAHFDAATFAIYAVGCLQIPLVDFMATPASNVMMVQMGEDLRQGRPERLLAVWRDTTRKLSFLFFPLVGLLIANAYHLITLLYTTAYADSVPIFMVWAPTILFAVFQTDGVLRTFAQNRFLLVMNLTRLATVFVLMSWSLSAFHLLGPVLVTLAGLFIAKAMSIVRVRKLLRAGVADVLPWKTLAGVFCISVVSAGPAMLLNAKLAFPSIVVLPLAGMAYVVTYTTLLFGLGLLNESEKRAIKGTVSMWMRRWAQPAREA